MLAMPIDASMAFLAGSNAEPLLDYETKAPRTDREGKPYYRVQLIARGAERSETLNVKTVNEPKGIVVHDPVKVTGLSILVFSRNGETGVTFVADRIEPALRRAAA